VALPGQVLWEELHSRVLEAAIEKTVVKRFAVQLLDEMGSPVTSTVMRGSWVETYVLQLPPFTAQFAVRSLNQACRMTESTITSTNASFSTGDSAFTSCTYYVYH